jgi:hypothetical protein
MGAGWNNGSTPGGGIINKKQYPAIYDDMIRRQCAGGSAYGKIFVCAVSEAFTSWRVPRAEAEVLTSELVTVHASLHLYAVSPLLCADFVSKVLYPTVAHTYILVL